MIEGITILAQEEILEVDALTVIFSFLVPIAIGILLGALISYLSNDDDFIKFFALLGVLFAILLPIFVIENGEPTGEYTYKVMIEDNVSMTEFYDKYEVLNQDGLIYKIKERENQ